MAAEPNAPEVGSPAWWLTTLFNELANRQSEMDLMDRYYTGDHPLPFLTSAHEAKMRSQFRLLLEASRTNFMALVVDTVEERLRVDGFRLSASSDPLSDKASWEIWQGNGLDAGSQTAFVEALIKGVSYLSVWMPDPAVGGKKSYPKICVEDASQTIVGYVPGSNYTQRAAALKVWTDDWTGDRRANVYMPDGIYKFLSRGDQTNSSSNIVGERPLWVALADTSQAPNPVKNPLNVVPIIPLRNRPRLLWEGESELAGVYRVQEQINALIFLQQLAAYFGGHRQRYVTGMKMMIDENTGREIEPFDVAIDKLWHSESEDAKFGEFDQTDLTQFIKSIDQKVQHIAITTRTPKHYLLPEGQEPSGDAISSAESGLIKKVERKQRTFGEGLEEAIRLARQFGGQDDSPVDSEIVWHDPQTESVATITDAVIKQFAAGLIPWEMANEKLGYSQTEIERMAGMRMSDLLMKGLTEPENPDVDWKGAVTT